MDANLAKYFKSDDFQGLTLAAQLPIKESIERVTRNEEAVFDINNYFINPKDSWMELYLLPHLVERMNNLLMFNKYCSDFEMALWG